MSTNLPPGRGPTLGLQDPALLSAWRTLLVKEHQMTALERKNYAGLGLCGAIPGPSDPKSTFELLAGAMLDLPVVLERLATLCKAGGVADCAEATVGTVNRAGLAELAEAADDCLARARADLQLEREQLESIVCDLGARLYQIAERLGMKDTAFSSGLAEALTSAGRTDFRERAIQFPRRADMPAPDANRAPRN